MLEGFAVHKNDVNRPSSKHRKCKYRRVKKQQPRNIPRKKSFEVFSSLKAMFFDVKDSVFCYLNYPGYVCNWLILSCLYLPGVKSAILGRLLYHSIQPPPSEHSQEKMARKLLISRSMPERLYRYILSLYTLQRKLIENG